MGGSPLGLPPSSPLPPPFPPTACQAPPLPPPLALPKFKKKASPLLPTPGPPLPPPLALPKFKRKCFLQIQNFAGVAVSAILGGSPLGLPPSSPPPRQAPPFPLLSPFQNKCFLRIQNFAGVAVSAILGGSPLGLPPSSPLPPPFLPPPARPPPSPSSRPSKIQEKVFLTDSCGRCRLSDFGRISPRPPPSSPLPPPFPPTACQAPPFPLLSPFQNSRESVSYRFRTLRALPSAILGGSPLGLPPLAHSPPPLSSHRLPGPPLPPPLALPKFKRKCFLQIQNFAGVAVSAILGGSPLGLPPSSPLPPPFPPTACQAPPFPLLSHFQRKCFLRIQNFAGVAVSAILGGSPLGLPPLAHSPPPFLPPLSDFGGGSP